MVNEKVIRFQGKNKELGPLGVQIEKHLKTDGYQTQIATTPKGTVIQAKKAGILRDIITADRAFTIVLAGQPNDFTVKVGIGKLVQNLVVAAAEAILLEGIPLLVDVPEMLWTTHVQKGVIQEITQVIG
ncbi:MAG TPA: hypothetical protein VJ021_00315 [Thermoplasmata archaeon]|nr:hypothetical protein [Thermoplasmata archaeon]